MATVLDSMLVQTPDICGGRLRIAGTRITVHRVATLYKQGQTADDIVQTYPHLSYSQVYIALAYYHENQARIDAELAAIDAEYDRVKEQNQLGGRLASFISRTNAETMINRIEFL